MFAAHVDHHIFVSEAHFNKKKSAVEHLSVFGSGTLAAFVRIRKRLMKCADVEGHSGLTLCGSNSVLVVHPNSKRLQREEVNGCVLNVSDDYCKCKSAANSRINVPETKMWKTCINSPESSF